MNKITLHNPEIVITEDEVFRSRGDKPEYRKVESPGQDILNYPIEEPKLDSEGKMIPRNKPPFYEPSGRSLEWSIKAGETERFPEYVAKILLNRYPFLQQVENLKETAELEPTKMEEYKDAKPEDGSVHCRECGQKFKSPRALGLHMGARHPEKLY